MSKNSKNDEKKIIQLINFIEELSWLLDTKKNIFSKESTFLLRELVENRQFGEVSRKYSSVNRNKNTLVGILPNFFQDESIFKTNLDISEFAKSILNIVITRPEKRSKYELIGLISCEVNSLNDENLTNLVEALANITNNNEKIKQLREAKKASNFSWNTFLQNFNQY